MSRSLSPETAAVSRIVGWSGEVGGGIRIGSLDRWVPGNRPLRTKQLHTASGGGCLTVSPCSTASRRSSIRLEQVGGGLQFGIDGGQGSARQDDGRNAGEAFVTRLCLAETPAVHIGHRQTGLAFCDAAAERLRDRFCGCRLTANRSGTQRADNCARVGCRASSQASQGGGLGGCRAGAGGHRSEY